MPHSVLKSALNDCFFGTIKDGVAFLRETDVNARLKLVKIKNVPSNSILIASDNFPGYSIFKENKGQDNRCDFILFSKEKLYFFEMKTHKDSPTVHHSVCIKKFKAVDCLSDYIKRVLEEFYDSEVLKDIQKRFIMLYLSPSISKTKTSLKSKQQTIMNDKPEKMLFLGVANEATVDINELSK